MGLRPLALATAALLALAACGDDDDGAPAPPAAGSLDPAFSGTWTGTTTLSASGFAPISTPSSLVIAASGQSATVSRICPDGSGSVTAQGSGNTAQWQGSFACPAVEIDPCPAVTLTYRNAALTLNVDGTLTASASGTASGCTVTTPVTATFTGSR